MKCEKTLEPPFVEAANTEAPHGGSPQALDQVFNRLWTGNSAGVVTCLSVIASGKVHYQQIVPALVVFGLGLVGMGLASCLELVADTLRRDRKPAPRWLIRIAFLSALMFLAGMIWAIGLTLYILLQP